ncbi:MAG TPA: YbhN family protein [Luteimonas sp.]|nr:YbhN family protein [Luteimonas sp.]
MKTRHPLLHRYGRPLFFLFLGVVAVLLFRYARSVDWAGVGRAIAAYDAATLATAAGLSLLSYAIYTCYDIAAKRYAHHDLPAPRVAFIAAVCYAFSLNLGAVVGSAGFRYRLYTRSGVPAAAVHRVVAFSVSANWLGYLLLAGLLFVSRSVEPPAGWRVHAEGLQIFGVAMLALVAAYLFACWRTHGKVMHVRGRHFRLPSPQLALLQMTLAACNWATMGAILYVLLQQQADYPLVLGALLSAAVAMAVAHIPAGVGVLEAVFMALLGAAVAKPELLAALLVYRGIYYLAPLAIAAAAYAIFETRNRRSAAVS